MTNTLSPLHILVVDDEPLVRWALAETLGAAGEVVVKAEDGQQAMRAIANASAPFDVVLLDYALPDVQHLELLEAVRQVAPTSSIILMTVYLTPEIAAEALARGASRVVAKPIEMANVPALVREVVPL